jgi:hypothetical protein
MSSLRRIKESEEAEVEAHERGRKEPDRGDIRDLSRGISKDLSEPFFPFEGTNAFEAALLTDTSVNLATCLRPALEKRCDLRARSFDIAARAKISIGLVE